MEIKDQVEINKVNGSREILIKYAEEIRGKSMNQIFSITFSIKKKLD